MTDGHIIIVAGQNSVGKTTTFRLLTQEAKKRKLLYNPEPFSDLFFMVRALQEDDAQGGFNHYHEWSVWKDGGHRHDHGEAKLQFTVVSNKLVDAMFHNFFTALDHAPLDELLIVQWTGGKNVNLPNEPASRADFSFTRTGELLREGALPSTWLRNVRAVIHPVADTETRRTLNEMKHAITLEDALTEHLSPKKSLTVLDIFGKDDFVTIENIFLGDSIPVYSIRNDASPQFYAELREVARDIFLPRTAKAQRVELAVGAQKS